MALIYIEDYAGTDNQKVLAALDAAQPRDKILAAARAYEFDREILADHAGTRRIYGRGSTFKRADGYETTLTAGASDGATTLQVADASGFEVGQEVGIVSGVGNADYLSKAVAITAINSNTLTVNAINSDVEIGDTVFRQTSIFHNTNGRLILHDFIFDGNKANNTTSNSWRYNYTISGSAPLEIYDGLAQNTPSENFLVTGGSIIDGLNCRDLDGSMIHVTNSSSAPLPISIKNIYGYDVCQASDNGHNESWVTFSNIAKNVTIEDAKIAGVGTAALPNVSYEDGDLVLRRLDVSEAASGITMNASTKDVILEGFCLRDSVFRDCGLFRFLGNSLASGFYVDHVELEGVRFIGTNSLQFKQVKTLNLRDVLIGGTLIESNRPRDVILLEYNV